MATASKPLRPVKTYAVYTRCDHCGIYDRDPRWCDLCGRPKDASVHRVVRPSGRAGLQRHTPLAPIC